MSMLKEQQPEFSLQAAVLRPHWLGSQVLTSPSKMILSLSHVSCPRCSSSSEAVCCLLIRSLTLQTIMAAAQRLATPLRRASAIVMLVLLALSESCCLRH